VSDTEIVVLGAIAGFTIFLGLPVARMRSLSIRARSLLNAGAAGVLVFLFVEIVEHGIGPIDEALEHAVEHDSGWGDFAWKFGLYGVLFAVGLLSLVYYDRWLAHRRDLMQFGPGAASATEFRTRRVLGFMDHEPTRLAFFIALGIGLHNFSEGLAIGQSGASGEYDLALLLIVGFALHNATEGFGIAGPLAGAADAPTWRFLLGLGLLGGGPTFLGTLIGQSFVDETLEMAFLALAAGSILYVVVQLMKVASKLGHEDMVCWGLLLGFFVGLATEFVIEAAEI
jgi:ZIP family zinc transporter